MRLKVEKIGEGLHPREITVAVNTVNEGRQRVVLSKSSLDAAGTIEVGVIGTKDGKFLVELPRETQSGAWRVWVPESALTKDRVAA